MVVEIGNRVTVDVRLGRGCLSLRLTLSLAVLLPVRGAADRCLAGGQRAERHRLRTSLIRF